jgi:hypothetical protein
MTLWTAALTRRRNLALVGGVFTLVLVAAILGSPLVASLLLGIGMTSYATLCARDAGSREFARLVHGPLGPPLQPEVAAEEIETEDLRHAYLAILAAHEELRVSLTDCASVLDALRDLYERCTDMVQAAGRMARGGNALSLYLAAQNPSLPIVAARLDGLGAATKDEDAARAYRHAAAVSRQHAELNGEIAGMYDRTKGRLAAALAFLGVARALVVKLRAIDSEAALAEGESITESVAELRGELELLRASLETALAT